MRAALGWIVLWGVLIVAALPLGFYTDDFDLAFLAREASWGQLLSFQTGPFPLYLIEWKLAGLLYPDAPYVLVRIINVTLHVLHCAMLWALLPRLLGRAVPALFVISLVLYRMAAEPLTWAAASAEPIVACANVGALWLWMKREERPTRNVWLAFACFVIAALTKASAFGLPALLVIYDRIERGRWVPGSVQARAALAAMGGLAAAVFAWGIFHPGVWASGGVAFPSPVQGASTWGTALAYQFTLVSPLHVLPAGLVSLLSLGIALVLCRHGGGVPAFGVVWILLHLAPPVFARGLLQIRYGYPAMLGTFIVLAWIWEKLAERPRWLARGAAGLLVIWGIGNLALSARQYYWAAECAPISRRVRQLVVDARGSIEEVGALAVVNYSDLIRESDLLKYDFGRALPVWHVGACTEQPGLPCLVYEAPLGDGSGCVGRDARAHVTLGLPEPRR